MAVEVTIERNDRGLLQAESLTTQEKADLLPPKVGSDHGKINGVVI